MTEDFPSLGELEARVLQLVWQHQPCTERQISDFVRKERDVARTTVLKTMQRLEGKRLLVREQGKGPNRFRAAIDEKQAMPRLVQRFVDRVLGGSADPLVAYLADSEKLSAKDLEALKKIARKIAEEKEKEQT